MKHKYVFNSIWFKMIIVFMIFGSLLVALLIVNNAYAIKVVRNQVAQSNKNLLTLYMNQIDKNLDETDKYLYNLVAFNDDLLSLELSEKENANTYNLAKIQLLNLLSNDKENYKSIDLFFVYSIASQDMMMTQSFGNSYTERETIRNDIIGVLQNDRIFKNYKYDTWLPLQIGDKYYFCHVVKENGVFVGAWVSADELMIPLNLVDFGKNGKAMLANENHQPMNNADFVKENKIDLAYSGSGYTLTGDKDKYLVVQEKSTKGKFSLIAVLPDNVILQKLPYFQSIVTIVPFVAIVILLVYSFMLRKIILIPIYRIVAAMKRIKGGHWEEKIEQRPASNEFALMQETFNNMVSQIHDLKINVYEEQLNVQKAELKHLQLQINPHFFLNSLNVIYQLAQVGNYKLIQEMSLCLVRYFRFMFRSNSTFISLEDELMHIRNYLRIQELRFPGYLTYETNIPDSLLDCQIPPLVIQTFVENTIKHAVTMDEPIHISINVNPVDIDNKRMIKILIQDTGEGYSDEVLENLKSGLNTTNDQGEHIGIWNVQRRLHMLYQGYANVVFYNHQKGGACTEITVPITANGQMEENQCTGCS